MQEEKKIAGQKCEDIVLRGTLFQNKSQKRKII